VVYPARREPILLAVLAFDGLFTLGVSGWMIWSAATGRGPVAFFFIAPSLIVSFLFAFWMLTRSAYEIEGSELIVRQGPSRRRIPIASIDEVFPTSHLSSSPAWAKNRLQVLFVPGTKARTLFLDPEDREAFLQGLTEADGGLLYDGQKVARGSAPS
jgi:hypothetical protein